MRSTVRRRSTVDRLVESFGKLIGEQGYAEMGYRTPEVGVGVATWAIRREWAMTHWSESANLIWRNLEHVTGRCVLGARQDEALHAATRGVGRRRAPRRRDAPRERHQSQAPPHGAGCGERTAGERGRETW